MYITRDTCVIQVTIREIIGADRQRREFRRNSAATSRDMYRRKKHCFLHNFRVLLQNITIMIWYLIKYE